jgi:hypothetical protein
MSADSKATESQGKAGNQTEKHSDNDLQGEGNYDAARRYDEKLGKFVTEKKSEIPGLAKDAERALDGPEGDALRKAEEAGKAKAKH